MLKVKSFFDDQFAYNMVKIVKSTYNKMMKKMADLSQTVFVRFIHMLTPTQGQAEDS